MPDEALLRNKAREAIRSGKLPSVRPSRLFGGPGTKGLCALCGEPLRIEQSELEIEFARDGSNPGVDRHYFHVPCFAVWELERTKAATGTR